MQSEMTLRDRFAAAALNGLLARRDCYDHEIAALAWAMADAMLRERCRSGGDCPLPDNAPNHDAAPAARAWTPGTGDTQSFDAYAMFAGSVMNWISEATSAADWSSDGGRKIMAQACSRCWDVFDRIAYPTDHGASPEARAESDEDRTDKAATSHRRDGTGDTPVTEPMPQEKQAEVSDRSKPITGPDPDSRAWETHTPATHATQGECSKPREGAEPVAWAVMLADGERIYDVYATEEEAKAIDEAVTGNHGVVPLYRHPPCQDSSQKNLTLTDAEREALSWARNAMLVGVAVLPDDQTHNSKQHAATLGALLERTE